MKIAWFGIDAFSNALERLIHDGHEIVHLFVFRHGERDDFVQKIKSISERDGISLSYDRPTASVLNELAEAGCELFLSAGYLYKIPAIPDGCYGLNLHPSLLPKGRGVFPLPYILMDHPDAAGFTLHKLTAEFDKGDVIGQFPVEVADDETHDTLAEKIVEAAPDFLAEIVNDLPRRWDDAKRQDESQASYWPFPPMEMRTIDWGCSIADIDRIGRAFGSTGIIADIAGKSYWIFSYKVWSETHDHVPGSVYSNTEGQITIAASDGFVCIKDLMPKS